MKSLESGSMLISFLVTLGFLAVVSLPGNKFPEQSLQAPILKNLSITKQSRLWPIRNRWKNKKDQLIWDKEHPNKRVGGDVNVFTVQHVESCCPVVYEMIEPVAGRNRTGQLVELYQDERVRQRFYEVSCRLSILNQPCKFLESRYSKLSKCIQQHSFTYALVRPPEDKANSHGSRLPQQWSLDYISIRSGCSCQIINTRRRKKYPQK